jgi:hypothetical protein
VTSEHPAVAAASAAASSPDESAEGMRMGEG